MTRCRGCDFLPLPSAHECSLPSISTWTIEPQDRVRRSFCGNCSPRLVYPLDRLLVASGAIKSFSATSTFASVPPLSLSFPLLSLSIYLSFPCLPCISPLLFAPLFADGPSAFCPRARILIGSSPDEDVRSYGSTKLAIPLIRLYPPHVFNIVVYPLFQEIGSWRETQREILIYLVFFFLPIFNKSLQSLYRLYF